MTKENVAVIIPVYNEAIVVGDVVNGVLKEFKFVVCVNDGSTDNTSDVISATKAMLINHPINMGQGAALQTGIEFARQLPVDYFVTFDADGQHSIDDVKKMLDIIKDNEYDIVLGSRFLGGTIGINKSKKAILKLAIKFSNTVSGIKLTDTHNGLRVFNRYVAENIQITMADMSHASEIIEIIRKCNFRYTEAPVVIKYTDYSKGKGQTLINAINIGFDSLLRRLSK